MHVRPGLKDGCQLLSKLQGHFIVGSQQCIANGDCATTVLYVIFVCGESTYLHVSLVMVGKSKQDCVLDRSVLDPRDLSNIGNSGRQNPVLEGSVLVTSQVHRRCSRDLDIALEDVGLANDSSEQQALASAGLAVDHAMNCQQTIIWTSVICITSVLQ